MIARDALRGALRQLDAAQQVNADAPPVIAVVGAFSRGKSALINALIDTQAGSNTPLLPVHPLPTTAAPTRIAYADTPYATLIYADREQSSTLEDVHAIAAYRGTTGGLREIQLGWPGALLKSGLILLDTPGIDAQVGLTPIFGADVAAFLFVFAADPPLGELELDFLREIATAVPRIVLVQTKCDGLTESALQQVTTFNRAAIDDACPALSATPIHSVSALTSSGIGVLRELLAGWDTEMLRQEREAWQIRAARSQVQSLLATLQAEQARLDAISGALKAAHAVCMADLAAIRAEVLATLARLSEYALGNLSAMIYQTAPIRLADAQGLTLAHSELCHVRDQLVGELERALIESRRRLIQSLVAVMLPIDTIPELPTLGLPDPHARTVTVRVKGRRVFQSSRLDADQTIKAYRTAVAHMADGYAAELLPSLESFLGSYETALNDALGALAAEFDVSAPDFGSSISL